MQVTHLDGIPALSVTEGQEYFVPCVFGIPVIMPSHIDEATDGPTGRHWHTDDRFGSVCRNTPYWSGDTRAKFDMLESDGIRTDIIKDEGQHVALERKTAYKTEIKPSGAVFTTVVWLYYVYGTEHARDGQCVHHPTSLVQQEGCLTCPSHGLKYKSDGSPRYQGPFFISIPYTDWDYMPRHIRRPVSFKGEHGEDINNVKFKVRGYFGEHPLITLEDNTGEVIMQCTWDGSPIQMQEIHGGTSTIDLKIGAWPNDMFCPRLVHKDPRK